MCGRFVLRTPPNRLAEYFDAEVAPGVAESFRPRFNVAPTTDVLALAADAGGRRTIGRYRWGLVPHWARDPSIGTRMFNARDDRLASSRAFGPALRRRRLVVLADGYWEWQKAPDGGRQPFYFHRPDGHPLAIAGLYEHWRAPGGGGQRLSSCTIVTTAAPPALRAVHDRMPAMVPLGTLDSWLEPGERRPGELIDLLAGAGPDLDAYPVDKRVGNVRNDDEHLLDPVPLHGA